MSVELGQACVSDTDCFSRYISNLKKMAEMVLETLVFSSLNHLTQLVAREYFIMKCRRESYKSDVVLVCLIKFSARFVCFIC
jgi:hypothetical protein